MGVGCNRNATGGCSDAVGNNTTASGFAAHAEGYQTVASGVAAHAEGNTTRATNSAAHAEGGNTIASGGASHAEGSLTAAQGFASHAEGIQTIAQGNLSHAEGGQTLASGVSSHAEGNLTISSGFASHAEGEYAIIDGMNVYTIAFGEASHAEGQATNALGEASHAEGFQTTAGTTTSGLGAHSEGYLTFATGEQSHAEGLRTRASGIGSHSEGGDSTSSGNNAHAEGSGTIASNSAAHAEGFQTMANGVASHSEGVRTSTAGFTAAHIMGQFGSANEATSWFLVNGTIRAKISGNTGIGTFTGGTNTGPADYAELFETQDGKPIEPGYLITLDGDKVRKATSADSYYLGVTSVRPGVLGNSADFEWQGKYLKDEWGRVIAVPAKGTDPRQYANPEALLAGEYDMLLNPEYDPALPYKPRVEREEWVAVGLLGQLLLRDDGTCQANGYCTANDEGIATAAANGAGAGYRVMKRTGERQILVMVK